MCLRCLGRALKYVKSVEWAVTSTGGAAIAALQVVHHKHCPDPNCENEGHCHIRVRRVDGTSGAEWVRANGTLDQCRESIGRCFKGVPIDVFDEIFEADERGLSRECLDLVEAAAAARHGAVAGECAICMEDLDGMQVVGGFAKLRVSVLPCGHAYHLSCYKQWAQKHTTCPVCRSEVTLEALRAAAGPGASSAPPAKMPALAPEPAAATPQPKRSRFWRGSRLSTMLSSSLPRIRTTRRHARQ